MDLQIDNSNSLDNIFEQDVQVNENIKSKEFFKSIFNNAGIGIGLVNLEGNIIQTNRQLSEMLGYTNEELLKFKFTDITYEEDINIDIKLFDELVNNKRERYQIEKRYLSKYGNIIWVKLTVSLINDEYGNHKYALGMMENITDSKKSREELIESKNMVVNILESISDAFFTLDNNWCFSYVNKQAEIMFGREASSLIGKNIWEEFKRLVNSKFYFEYLKAVEEQVSVVFEEYYYHLKSWYSVHAYPSINGLSVYIRDITEEKVLNEKLKDKEERLSLVLETLPNGIIIISGRGNIEYINAAALKQLGIDKEEAYGRRYNDPSWNIYTLDGTPYYLTKLPFFTSLRQHKPVNNVELMCRRKDGTDIILSCNAASISSKEHGIPSFLISLTDITQIKKAEQKAVELNFQLEKMSSLDGLTGIDNRRSFDGYMEREWKRCLRESKSLSVIMIDIDHFKAFNDTYGHQGGDNCLKEVAETLSSLIKRSPDTVCRYGGEEFAIILPETDEAGARIVAERLRIGIEDLRILHVSSRVSKFVTISLGVASIVPNKYITSNELIERADKALYKAKLDGRNRCSVYSSTY